MNAGPRVRVSIDEDSIGISSATSTTRSSAASARTAIALSTSRSLRYFRQEQQVQQGGDSAAAKPSPIMDRPNHNQFALFYNIFQHIKQHMLY